MKQQSTTHRTLLRTTQIAIASAAFALIAACGGGGGGSNNAGTTPPSGVNMQVVAFGTSLTDAGTYEPILLGFGGGRFTTNPGEVWAQKVSEYFGSPLTPAFEGGFGSTLQATGGLDYAQGGAWVATNAATADPFTTAVGTTTQMPLTWQVQQYLSQHGSFNANQIVLVEGGANDILNNITTILGTVVPQILSNPAATQAQIAGYVQTATQNTLQSSAAAFATVVGQILANGAKHVAVMNVPDIGNTPLSQANGEIQTAIGGLVSQALQADNVPAAAIPAVVASIQAQVPALVSGVVQTYNGMVTYALNQGGIGSDVIPVDSFTWLDSVMSNYSAQGFTVGNTGTACNLTAMASNATSYYLSNPSAIPGGVPQGVTTQQAAQAAGSNFASSLFCSPSTYTVANADQTYVFADTIHPATRTHELFANYVEQQLAAAGLGKAP